MKNVLAGLVNGVAALLFIFALAGLSKHETSKQGIVYGIAGMAIALAGLFGGNLTLMDGKLAILALTHFGPENARARSPVRNE